MPNRKYEMPFSRERLADLYLTHTLYEIATIAAEIAGWDTIPTRYVVDRWLRENNIHKRTRQESMMLHDRLGKNQRIHTNEASINRVQSLFSPFKTKPIGRRFTDAEHRRAGNSTRKMLAKTHVTRHCSQCNKPVTRPAYKMRGEHIFCNKSCHNTWRHRQRPEISRHETGHQKQAEALKRRNQIKTEQRRAEWTPLGFLDTAQVAERTGTSVSVVQKDHSLGKLISTFRQPCLLFNIIDVDAWNRKRKENSNA